MSAELKPCQFCGSRNIGMRNHTVGVQHVCMDCDASGPFCEGNPETELPWVAAKNAWNTRTITPAQAAKVLLDAMVDDADLWTAMTEAAETAFDAGASMNKALGNALRRAIAEGNSK